MADHNNTTSNSGNPTSTAQALYDKAAGVAQSAYHSIVGNPEGQAQAENRQDKAQAEYDASHATVKVAGYSASSSGTVTKDDPDRAAGSWNQTIVGTHASHPGRFEQRDADSFGGAGLRQRGPRQPRRTRGKHVPRPEVHTDPCVDVRCVLLRRA